MGGGAQELLLLSGHADLGIAVMLPILVLVVGLWRPRTAAVAIVLLCLGIEMVIPLHTGGGRSEDWLLHYQVALNYAGLPNGAYLLGRTPLFHQLVGSILRHSANYWTFQLVAVLLNCLWLWPALLLIERTARNRPAVRLLAVALAPVTIAYSTYTWPWNFSAFFLLAALWLADEAGWVASAGVGAALGGALMVHPGSLGYVLGLGGWWLFKQRRQAWPGVSAGALVVAGALPWVLAVTAGRGPAAMLSGSIPALQRVPPAAWLVSRLLIIAHTFAPPLAFAPDRAWVNVALGVVVLTLPGALITVLAATRLPGLHGATLATVALGAAVALAIYPANQDATGMLDGLYLGVLVFLVDAAARLGNRQVGRVFRLSLVAGSLTVAGLLWLGFAPIEGDANAALRELFHISFFEQRWGLTPGILLVLLALALVVLAVRRPPGRTVATPSP